MLLFLCAALGRGEITTRLSGTTYTFSGRRVSNFRETYLYVTGSGSTLKVDSCSFTRMITSGSSYGGAVYCGVNFLADRTKFVQCECTRSGGAVYLFQYDDMTNSEFQNCEFQNCEAGDGGAVFNSASRASLLVSECYFSDCRASSGAAVLVAFGQVEMTDSFITDITGNTVTMHQVVYLYSKSEMRNCTCTGWSGHYIGIYCHQYSQLDIYNCSFTGMEPSSYLISSKNDVQLFNSSFVDVTGQQSGAAVSVSNTLVIDGCWFDNCVSTQGAITGAANVDIQWTNFTACASAEKGGVLYLYRTSGDQTLSFRNCITNGLSANSNRGEIIYCELYNADVVFENNTFSINNSAGSVIYITVYTGSSFVFRECRFQGNKDEGVIINQFLNLLKKSAHREIELVGCTFEDIEQRSGGNGPVTGLLPSAYAYTGHIVKIVSCVFEGLVSETTASAIDGQSVSEIHVESCEFHMCQATRSQSVLNTVGAVLIRGDSNFVVSITNNSFKANDSPGTQSLVIALPTNDGSRGMITVSNCSFCDHTGSKPLLRVVQSSSGSEYGISCDITIDNCEFISNSAASSEGMISLGSNSRYGWFFNECVFDQCTSSSGCLIMPQSASFDVGSLSFASCVFVQCQFMDGITSRSLMLSELLCENCSFDQFNVLESCIFWVENTQTNARFSSCKVTECVSSFKMHVDRLIFDDVEFIGIGATWDVSAENECLFNCSHITAKGDTSADLFSWSGRGQSAQIRLLNCCFTGLVLSSSGHYISLSGSGTATFDDTCFDQSRDKCLSVAGSVSIELDEPSSMFGRCSCDGEYIVVTSSIPLEPDDSVPLEPDDSVPLEPDSSIPTQPDSSKGSSKAGLIAGIVVCALILAGVAGALLFLFVFRRHRRRADFSTSSEDNKPATTVESAAETEVVEETVPWTRDQNPWETPEDIGMWL